VRNRSSLIGIVGNRTPVVVSLRQTQKGCVQCTSAPVLLLF
jgi:hypothetical protein